MAAAPALSAGVLQEEEDVLVNVNLVDKERAEKNVELRKKKPDYLPYAEDESVDGLAQAGRAARGCEMGALGLFRNRLDPDLSLLSCSRNPAPSCPSTTRSSRASGRTPSAWSRAARLTACGNGSWRRSGPSCGYRLSP